MDNTAEQEIWSMMRDVVEALGFRAELAPADGPRPAGLGLKISADPHPIVDGTNVHLAVADVIGALVAGNGITPVALQRLARDGLEARVENVLDEEGLGWRQYAD